MTAREIRRWVLIGAPRERVWPWVGRPEGLERWWCPPPTVRLFFEPRPGSRFVELYDDGTRSYRVEGVVEECLPLRRLVIRRRTPGSASPADRIAIVLNARRHETCVTVVHRFERVPDRRWPELERFFGPPWAESLASLKALVADGAAGEPPTGWRSAASQQRGR